jgi:hypothetical protein
MNPLLSPPQPPHSETTYDHPSPSADAPERPQQGSVVIPTIPGGLEQSATVDPPLDPTNRTTIPENTVLDSTLPAPRTANNHTRESPGHRHNQVVVPDPVNAAPDPPRIVVHRTTGNQRRLSTAGRILAFFGYGRNNRARKELVSIIWTLVVDFSQVNQLTVYFRD